MYSIGNIGYGIIPDKKMSLLMDKYDLKDYLREINDDCHTYYSGSSDTTPFFIGYELGSIDGFGITNINTEIDEVFRKSGVESTGGFKMKIKWDQTMNKLLVDILSIKEDLSEAEYNLIVNWIENTQPFKLICWGTS